MHIVLIIYDEKSNTQNGIQLEFYMNMTKKNQIFVNESN